MRTQATRVKPKCAGRIESAGLVFPYDATR